MDFLTVFRERGKHLTWRRLDDDNVTPAAPGTEICADKSYFIIRLSEVYLARSRTLWRRFYPVVHAWGATETGQEHGLAAPTQLQQVSEAGLDRVITLNARLLGPTPYRGGDVSLVAGLYAVPGDDVAQALVSTVSALTALTGSAIPAGSIAKIVTDGVDKILGLDRTTLQLGVCDTFYPNNVLRTGFHIGLGARPSDVDFSRLWLRDRHLVKGPDPYAAKPYEDHDYVVVEVERREVRDDWPGLPGMAELQEKLEAIMKLSHATVAFKREKLADFWPEVISRCPSGASAHRHNADDRQCRAHPRRRQTDRADDLGPGHGRDHRRLPGQPAAETGALAGRGPPAAGAADKRSRGISAVHRPRRDPRPRRRRPARPGAGRQEAG